MSEMGQRQQELCRSSACKIGVILTIGFVGYFIGLGMFAYGLVLAPRWTFLTSALYLSLSCLGLPLAIIAIWRKWLQTSGAILGLALAAVFFVFYLTLIGPGMPSGETRCEPIASTPPKVRYSCIDTSSDNPSYHHEFELEGFAWLPVMHVVHSTP